MSSANENQEVEFSVAESSSSPNNTPSVGEMPAEREVMEKVNMAETQERPNPKQRGRPPKARDGEKKLRLRARMGVVVSAGHYWEAGAERSLKHDANIQKMIDLGILEAIE